MKKLLKSKKIEIDTRTRRSATALYVASQKGHLVSLSGCSLRSLDSNEDIVKLLLKFGANTSLSFHNGFTPLHAATLAGHVKVVKCLLKGGADLNIVDHDRRTPFDLLAEVKNEKSKKKLSTLFEFVVTEE